MVCKKGQMGNMLHLVIIAVVILIAAMAIILMVTKNVEHVDEDARSNMANANNGIGDALRGIGRSCPGDSSVTACAGHIHKVTGITGEIAGATAGGVSTGGGISDGQQVCCTTELVNSNQKIVGSCEYIYTCNPGD